MKDKLQSDISNTIFTAVFAVVSYWFADKFNISAYVFRFTNDNWHETISIIIYVAILNSSFLWLISKRTVIQVEIVERKDKSNKISLDDKPRNIEVKIKILGNLKNINENIEISFPIWLDIMTKWTPDLEQDKVNAQKYYINLNEYTEKGKNEGGVFPIDIIMKATYKNTGRYGEITSEITGNCFRYVKRVEKLTVKTIHN